MSNEEKKDNLGYNDIPLFLLLVPFVNVLNYYLTYSNIPFNWHTVLTFSIDTLQGYAAWLIIRSIIMRMDKKIPYGTYPLKRILLQLVLTCSAALAVIILTTEFANRIAGSKPVPPGFYRFDLFIFLIWFFVVNGIYVGWHYYNQLNYSERLRLEEKKLRQTGFLVKFGKQHLTIPFSEIAGIYVEDDYAVIVTRTDKKYLSGQSLDKVEKLLPGESFTRANRQYIVHREVITGFQRIENGKVIITLVAHTYLPSQILVSRTKAAGFIAWFQS